MKTFKLKSHPDPAYEVTNFRWQTDPRNNALITWQWPQHPDVKYMLAAASETMPDDPLKWFMKNPAAHSVITRNLATHYEIAIGAAPRHFFFAPAYLLKKDVAVYGPLLVTDLLYAKVHVTTRIINTPMPFSPYKRVKFSLSYSEAHGAELSRRALRYTLHEFNRHIGTYPLDDTVQSGGVLHIKKTQHVRFVIEEEFAHVLALI